MPDAAEETVMTSERPMRETSESRTALASPDTVRRPATLPQTPLPLPNERRPI